MLMILRILVIIIIRLGDKGAGEEASIVDPGCAAVQSLWMQSIDFIVVA